MTESLQHLSRFAVHNLHLISCLEFWCAPITTNSERCVFKTLIWSSAQERCVSGTRRDVWMQRLSRREAAARLLSWPVIQKLMWGREALFRIISWSKHACKRRLASACHFSTAGSDTCVSPTQSVLITHTYHSVQDWCSMSVYERVVKVSSILTTEVCSAVRALCRGRYFQLQYACTNTHAETQSLKRDNTKWEAAWDDVESHINNTGESHRAHTHCHIHTHTCPRCCDHTWTKHLVSSSICRITWCFFENVGASHFRSGRPCLWIFQHRP